jgi:hypothetical protein
MLRTALGADIAAWLADPAVVEVMLNPDGRENFVEALGRRVRSGPGLAREISFEIAKAKKEEGASEPDLGDGA